MIDIAMKYDEEMLAKGLSAKLRPELVKGEWDMNMMNLYKLEKKNITIIFLVV